MTYLRTSFPRRRLRLLVLWLLAWVLPLQGMTAAAFTMLGPAHTHTASPPPLRLVDFRRQVAGTAPDAHAHATAKVAPAHVHASDEPERHVHAHDDPSLVLDADNAATLQRLVGDDSRGLSASLATVLAWVPADPAWALPGPVAQRPRATLWAPSCSEAERLERPPRRG